MEHTVQTACVNHPKQTSARRCFARTEVALGQLKVMRACIAAEAQQPVVDIRFGELVLVLALGERIKDGPGVEKA